MFFTNVFGFSERRAVCEHAYRTTRRHLLGRFEELAAVFARHGVTLRPDVLEEERDLWEMVGPAPAADPTDGARRLPAAAVPQAAAPPPPPASSPADLQRLVA